MFCASGALCNQVTAVDGRTRCAACSISLHMLALAPHIPNYRLPALTHSHMLDGDLLLALAEVVAQGEDYMSRTEQCSGRNRPSQNVRAKGNIMKPIWTALFAAAAALTIQSCAETQTNGTGVETSIYWSDGDSGRIDGERFRLADVDAPETGGVGGRGGAQCEAERVLGYEAKAFMMELTQDADLRVTSRGEEDRYGRVVVSLSANGGDLAALAMDAGHLRAWPHRNGRPQTDKPDWCAE
jgi:endonuclease YncB( thermonuclease family)